MRNLVGFLREQFDETGKHFGARRTAQGQRELGVEQTVFQADVKPAALQFSGKKTLARCELGERLAQMRRITGGDFRAEQIHHRRRQNVHSEKTQIMAGAQTGNDQFLFCNRRRWFFQNLRDKIKTFSIFREVTTGDAVVRQLAFVRRLHGGHGAVFRRRDFHELPRATAIFAAQIKVIADEQQKRIAAGEFMRAPDGVTVAERFDLLDKLQALAVRPRGGAISVGVAGKNHDADFIRARAQRFLDDDCQRGLGFAIAVHERLKWQRPLAWTGCGHDGFMYIHKFSFLVGRFCHFQTGWRFILLLAFPAGSSSRLA